MINNLIKIVSNLINWNLLNVMVMDGMHMVWDVDFDVLAKRENKSIGIFHVNQAITTRSLCRDLYLKLHHILVSH